MVEHTVGKIIIDNVGVVHVERAKSRMVALVCPRHGATGAFTNYCSDCCPLFGEPLKVISDITYVRLPLCEDVVFRCAEENFFDYRVSQE